MLNWYIEKHLKIFEYLKYSEKGFFKFLKDRRLIKTLKYLTIFYRIIIQVLYYVPIDTAVWMHYLDANKTAGKETRWQLDKNVACNIEQVQAATPHKALTIRPPASHHEKYPS